MLGIHAGVVSEHTPNLPSLRSKFDLLAFLLYPDSVQLELQWFIWALEGSSSMWGAMSQRTLLRAAVPTLIAVKGWGRAKSLPLSLVASILARLAARRPPLLSYAGCHFGGCCNDFATWKQFTSLNLMMMMKDRVSLKTEKEKRQESHSCWSWTVPFKWWWCLYHETFSSHECTSSGK